ncbi:hypothetical protein [Legionella worsleiensis]|uniref:EPTP domain protein n=1 Tax=Legionella worsleiensis TaxID=45076 RepID=A0A0W1AL04_9GAMM|nr:hypothetical protein [Legionella worsleiensis]KTD82020.1 EPTP domain protein [Legionella worsleiensis]STY30324.1 EPTP domain [Legionella worsleiensis]
MSLSRVLFYFFTLGFSVPGLTQQLLNPIQYFDTTGARELTPFELSGEYYIAAAQSGRDLALKQAQNKIGGDADVDVIIYKKHGEQFRVYQRIPGHGNSSATFFNLNGEAHIAIASYHSGPKSPFNPLTYSMLYRWDGRFFYPIQQFLTYGAKQSVYFNIGSRHFLAFANGIVNSENELNTEHTRSIIYEWDGTQFSPFQTLRSLRGESFKFFMMNKIPYLAFADSLDGGFLYRWDNGQFKIYQQFKGKGAQSFEHFVINNAHYLAYANSESNSSVYQWNGKTFSPFQELPDAGARNFVHFYLNDQHYLMRVNYKLTVGDKGEFKMQSPLYQWEEGHFRIIQNIPTFGGSSAHVFTMNQVLYMTIANCFNEKGQFNVNSVLYEITHGLSIEFG